MAADLYQTILEEIGKLMGIELKPDENQTCLVKLKTGVEIYFEIDKRGEYFVVGSTFGQILPGIYREKLFQHALKQNGAPPPHSGVFAYSPQSQSLVFYRRFLAEKTNGEEIFTTLPAFIKVATEWKLAIDQGNIPEVALEEGAPPKGGGIFGLK